MNVSLGGGIPQDSGEEARLPPLLPFKTMESLGFSRETGWTVGFFREGFFSSLKVTLHGLTDTANISGYSLVHTPIHSVSARDLPHVLLGAQKPSSCEPSQTYMGTGSSQKREWGSELLAGTSRCPHQ